MHPNLSSIQVALHKMKLSIKSSTDQFLVAISRFGKDFQEKMSRLHYSKANVSEQLNQSIGLLLEDRKRLVDELAQIRMQIETVASFRQINQEANPQAIEERDAALDEALELKRRLEELQKDRDEIVKDRQRLWEEYQKLAQSRDELRVALDAKEGGANV